MKIVIADDENLIRFSLKSMLDEVGFFVSVVGEARNGDELVALVKRHAPDVAIVDIRMPKLDGLQAIAKGREISPDTRWIVLTSYSEFDYAKEAIKLGAQSYLLKPVSPQELADALAPLKREEELGRIARAEQFESRMTRLLNRTAPMPAEARSPYAFVLAALIVVLDGTPEALEAERLELCAGIRAVIRESVTREQLAGLVPLPEGRLCAVFAWSPAQPAEGLQAFKRFVNRLCQLSSRCSEEGILATVLATSECGTEELLAAEVGRLLELSGLRAVAGAGGLIARAEIERCAADPAAVALAERAVEASAARSGANGVALVSALGDLERMHSALAEPDRARLGESLERFLAGVLHLEPPRAFRGRGDGPEGPGAWMERARREAARSLGREGAEALVEQVRGYVDRRYADDLRVSAIARTLEITPNYLSSLFHRKVGMTFVRYLTERRLLRARELLASEPLQVQEVARRVGYRSARRFTRAFKERFRARPSECRGADAG